MRVSNPRQGLAILPHRKHAAACRLDAEELLCLLSLLLGLHDLTVAQDTSSDSEVERPATSCLHWIFCEHIQDLGINWDKS